MPLEQKFLIEDLYSHWFYIDIGTYQCIWIQKLVLVCKYDKTGISKSRAGLDMKILKTEVFH